MKISFTLALLSIILFLSSPVYSLNLNEEAAAYNAGDYNRTISIGSQLISENPSEPNCHYYLANAYSRLGKLAEAQHEYITCKNLTDDPKLKDYCSQALSFFTQHKSTSENDNHLIISNQSFQRSVPPRREFSPFIHGENKFNGDLRAQQAQILDIREQYRDLRESVPRYFYTGRQRQPNPDYPDAIAALREEERQKIELIRSGGHLTPYGDIASPSPYMPEHYDTAKTPSALPPTQFLHTQQMTYQPALNNQYNNIPGHTKTISYGNKRYIDQLFNASPLPPPPFPANLKKAAEKALKQNIN